LLIERDFTTLKIECPHPAHVVGYTEFGGANWKLSNRSIRSVLLKFEIKWKAVLLVGEFCSTTNLFLYFVFFL